MENKIDQILIKEGKKEIEEGISPEDETSYEGKEAEQEKSIRITSIEKIGEAFQGPYMEAFTKAIAEGKLFSEANELAQMDATMVEAQQLNEQRGKQHPSPWRVNRNAEVYGENTLVYKSNSGRAYTITKNEDGSFGLHFFTGGSGFSEYIETLDEK